MKTANKSKPRGKPFQKGDDARRNPEGRPRSVGTAALRRVITDNDLEKMWKRTILDAVNGDKDARRDILDRLEGKAVARTEDGKPGDFDSDLEPEEISDLRSALKVVRGRNDD